MGYPTDSAKWPTTVHSTVVQLYDLFFTLVDTTSETSGNRLAEEVFAEDGIFMATSGSFEGGEAIRTCRKGVWNTVVSRHHEVQKVFACDTDGEILDLILAGTVEVEDSDHHKHIHEFLVRSVVVHPKSPHPRVKHYQLLVPAPKTPQPILT